MYPAISSAYTDENVPVHICVPLTRLRRHLHSHPELSFEEEATSRFIEAYLRGVDGVSDVKTGLAIAPDAFNGAQKSTWVLHGWT